MTEEDAPGEAAEDQQQPQQAAAEEEAQHQLQREEGESVRDCWSHSLS